MARPAKKSQLIVTRVDRKTRDRLERLANEAGFGRSEIVRRLLTAAMSDEALAIVAQSRRQLSLAFRRVKGSHEPP